MKHCSGLAGFIVLNAASTLGNVVLRLLAPSFHLWNRMGLVDHLLNGLNVLKNVV